MYQSINDSFVKTAYLKMIDYWLLFCLLIPFTVFMIEIFWLLRMNKGKGNLKNGKIFKDKKQASFNRRLIQILVPSLTILFIVSYLAAAYIISNF